MRTQILLVLVALIAFAYAGDFKSAQYQALTADQKMDRLWKAINEDTTPYGYYSKAESLLLLIESMKLTFDSYSDDMPGWHKKLIHSVGMVGKVEFVAVKNPYTGVFQGAKNVLLRLSLARAADPKISPVDNFSPGLGIKFLRDKVPSANLVAMKGLEGQDSWNFFKYDWSHHIAALPENCSYLKKLGLKKFETATPFTTRIGLKAWADFDQKGNLATKPNIPFKIYFRPGAAVKNLFPDTYKDDWMTQVSAIKPGTELYDIYATPNPHADAVKIGTIKTTSKFTTSKFGDKELFFQHNYMEDDLKLHPEWLEATKINPPVPSKLV